MDILAAYEKVEVTNARVVEDGNRLTGGGVALIGKVLRPEAAMAAELIFHYRPEPPFGTGDPSVAPEGVRTFVEGMLEPYAGPLREFVTNR